jgi:hypothetical protein
MWARYGSLVSMTLCLDSFVTLSSVANNLFLYSFPCELCFRRETWIVFGSGVGNMTYLRRVIDPVACCLSDNAPATVLSDTAIVFASHDSMAPSGSLTWPLDQDSVSKTKLQAKPTLLCCPVATLLALPISNQTDQVIAYHIYVSAVYPFPLHLCFFILTKHYLKGISSILLVVSIFFLFILV